jgi:hypothetical protein
MIDQCLDFLRGELNQFLKQKLSLAQDKVVLSGIIRQDGKLDPELELESIAMMVVNIEEETAIQALTNYTERDASYFKSNPGMHLNLKVLTVLNFTHHSEALKFLSALLSFFQSRPVFKKEGYPQFMPSNVDQLRLKFISQTLEQQNHLWGTLGAKYLPSLMFKVSLLKVQEDQILEEVPRIGEIRTQLKR